jgi:hypothetical protein
MPLETVTVTIQPGSANPQTKQVVINVDPNTGAGSGSISFSGINGGLDSIKATATIAGTSYSSNLAEVGWQGTNGAMSLINNVAIEKHASQGGHSNWNGTTSGALIQLANKNSIIVNQPINNFPIAGIVSDDGLSGQFRHHPPMLDDVKSDGTALTTNGSALGWGQPFDGGDHTTLFIGEVVIASPGVYTFYVLADDSWALYMPNVTRVGGTFVINGGNANMPTDANGVRPTGLNAAAANGLNPGAGAWPAMGMRNNAANSIQATDFVWINFPAAGIYPFMFSWVNDGDATAYFQPTWQQGQGAVPTVTESAGGRFGAVLKPVALQSPPPATVPAGNLQLGIQGGNLLIAGQSVTLTVSVNGIHYVTKPYIPILEGQTGKIYIYNDPSNPVFTFQTYNGQPVDPTAAAAAAFGLSGDNGSWQGRLSIKWVPSDSAFELTYNGNTFDAHVATTQLQITTDDIAWYNSVTKTFDTFVPGLSGGGNFAQIEIDYMVKPVVSSVSPLTVTADGAQHQFTVSFDRPFSPQQQGANNTGNAINTPVFTFPGGTVGTPTPILDSQGWLTGYTVPITVPTSSSNSSVALGMTLSGTLTRLVGDTFTTGSVTYVPTGTIATIQLTGVAFTAPTVTTITVSPTTGAAPSFTVIDGDTETLTATVTSPFNNNITCTFFAQNHGTSSRINLGNGTLTNTVLSGGLYFKTFTLSSVTSSWFTTNDIGAQATDTVSNLSSNVFFDSSTYTVFTPGGGGGGGGTGCPGLEMFVSEHLQVLDCKIGYTLACLSDDMAHYMDGVEMRNIESLSTSTQPCIHFIAANGAAVVVSESTPIPTREILDQIADGAPIETIPALARDIRVGMYVITDVGNGLEWSCLTDVNHVGMRVVAKLSVGGRNFAAGVQPGKYIFTHNAFVVVK